MASSPEELIKQIIADVADISIDDLRLDAELSSFGIDSLMALSIISKVERAFKIQIPEKELRGVRTGRQIVALLEKRCEVKKVN